MVKACASDAMRGERPADLLVMLLVKLLMLIPSSLCDRPVVGLYGLPVMLAQFE